MTKPATATILPAGLTHVSAITNRTQISPKADAARRHEAFLVRDIAVLESGLKELKAELTRLTRESGLSSGRLTSLQAELDLLRARR